MLSIEQGFDALRQHLGKRTACLKSFAHYEYQSEGWLKAESIALFDQLKRSHQILAVDREVTVKGQSKIDLTVQVGRARHWIELKHWYAGHQKGQQWRPVDFISELESECEKFEAVRAKGRA